MRVYIRYGKFFLQMDISILAWSQIFPFFYKGTHCYVYWLGDFVSQFYPIGIIRFYISQSMQHYWYICIHIARFSVYFLLYIHKRFRIFLSHVMSLFCIWNNLILYSFSVHTYVHVWYRSHYLRTLSHFFDGISAGKKVQYQVSLSWFYLVWIVYVYAAMA